MVAPEILDPLIEWLRIPSVSNGHPNPEALRAAAEWARDRVAQAGGDVELVETKGSPIVLGRFDSGKPRTVYAYGHYDVQDPEPLDLWTTPPFEPSIRNDGRDDRLYARGACDDKGNFWPLLYTTLLMATQGSLPVNVVVLVEGEEEIGSGNLLRWLANEGPNADACIIYDSGNMTGLRPAITLGARGLAQATITVRTGDRDLHSGLYGGSVPNAIHELSRVLQKVLPGPDGLLHDALRAGKQEVPDEERKMWKGFAPGEKVIEVAGGRQLHKTSGKRYYEQNFWEPSLDVNEIRSGSPRTVIPKEAHAHVTVRLAPGQKNEEIFEALRALLSEDLPSYVDLDVTTIGGVDAGSFDADDPVIVAGRKAFARACAAEPQLIRLGGTLPLLDVLQKRGISTILTGFASARDGVHGPDESYRLEALETGAVAARALYEELAAL